MNSLVSLTSLTYNRHQFFHCWLCLCFLSQRYKFLWFILSNCINRGRVCIMTIWYALLRWRDDGRVILIIKKWRMSCQVSCFFVIIFTLLVTEIWIIICHFTLWYKTVLIIGFITLRNVILNVYRLARGYQWFLNRLGIYLFLITIIKGIFTWIHITTLSFLVEVSTRL